MDLAIKRDIEIEQGTDYELTLRYKDPLGVPIPLAAYQAAMQIRDQPGGKSLYADLTTENGKIVMDDDGYINIRIPAAQTKLMAFKEGSYDFLLISPSGGVDKILAGEVTLTPVVTRR